MSDKVYVGQKAATFEKGSKFGEITGIRVIVDDDTYYISGDDTGRELELTCPWGTQQMADNVLSSVRGYEYRPFSASDVTIDHAAELGDGVTIAGTYSVLASADATLDISGMANISAPGEQEVDHEYPYESPQSREIKRKVSLGKNYYGAKITRREGLVIEKTDGDIVSAKAVLNSDELSFYDKSNNRVLYFDPITGTYQFKGTLNVNDTFKVDKLGNVTIGGTLTLSGESNWLRTLYAVDKKAAIPNGWKEWDSTWENTSTQVWAIYSYNGGNTWSQPMLAQGKDGAQGQRGPSGSDANVPDWVKAYTNGAQFNTLVSNEWVVSMNLYGGKIFGGAFYDDLGYTKLVLNPLGSTDAYADLALYSGETVALNIMEAPGGLTWTAFGNPFLFTAKEGAKQKTSAHGKWDFSDAAVTGVPVRFG